MGENSPVYIIRKKPFSYETGVLKSKGTKPIAQNPYIPQAQNTIDIVVSVGGTEEKLPNVPKDKEVLEYQNSFYSVTPEGILQAVSNMMQLAQTTLDDKGYYESVIKEGEKVIEKLNPQYAENKRQARIVRELQDHVDRQDKKLDTILDKLNELFSPSK